MSDETKGLPPEFAYLTEVGPFMGDPAPRRVVVAHPRWMEPYHRLEELELNKRLQSSLEFPKPFYLWLRALVLLQAPFVGRFDWSEGLTDEEREALDTRADMLATSAGASKPTLDALMAGYYWTACGQARSLLDGARRIGFLRLAGPTALSYFRAPDESPIAEDGSLRKGLVRLKYETMRDIFYSADAAERRRFDLLSDGVNHMHWGAHLSGESLLQLYAGEESRKVVGPAYVRAFCAFALKWGVCAHLLLLEELHRLRPQGEKWVEDVKALETDFGIWLLEYNAEFVDVLPDAAGREGAPEDAERAAAP